MAGEIEEGTRAEAEGRWDDAVRAYEAAVRRARRSKAPDEMAAASFRLGRVLTVRGRPDPKDALKHLARAHRLVRGGARIPRRGLPGGDGPVRIEELAVLEARATMLLDDGSAPAFGRLNRRLSRLLRSSDLRVRGEALWTLGIARLRRGQREEAVRVLGDAATIFERSGEARSLVPVLADLGRALVEHGCHRDAVPFLRSALEDAKTLRDADTEARAGIGLATALIPLGAFDEARRLLEEHDPEDLDLHRDAVLARASLDLEEGLERVRIAELRRFEHPEDLARGVALVRTSQEKTARILAGSPVPGRAAVARLLLAQADWALALRSGEARAADHARELARAAARECAAHAARHVAQRASALLAETESPRRGGGAFAAILAPTHDALRRRYAEIRRSDELRRARGVQDRLVGLLTPTPAGVDVWGDIRPANEVFGDFWLASSRGGTVHLVAGDVAGHGADAAPVMAAIVAELRERLLGEGPIDPEAQARDLDRWLENLGLPEIFTTLSWVSLDAATGRGTAVRMGDVGVIARNGAGEWSMLPPGGPPCGLGLGRAHPGRPLDLGPEGLVVLFTDGVRDQLDSRDRPFADRGVRRALGALPAASTAREVVAGVWSALDGHAGGAQAADDRTCAVLRVAAPP